MSRVFALLYVRYHQYITSAKGVGGSGKWPDADDADVQYCIYTDIVGGSEKVQNYADVIYE